MKTLRTLLVIAIALVGFTTVTYGQQTASQTASATVIKALKIESSDTKKLDFGTFGGKNNETSTVTISPDGTRGGSVDFVTTNRGSQGVFTITGESGSLISINIPKDADAIKLHRTAGTDGDDMLVTAWTAAIDGVAGTPDLSSVTLKDGSITLNIGATLNVGMDQKANTYSASYNVTVDYN